VGLDNFVRAGSELNREALRKLGIRVRHGDIRHPSDLEGLPPCDWILDAAANPSVLAGFDGQTSSRQLIEHNLAGTLNVLELAKTWRSGLILLSTSRVYSLRELAALPVEPRGDKFVPRATRGSLCGFGEQGLTEEFSTEPPLSLYGSSKRASEILAQEYAAAFQLPLFINRCGVLAGAGQFGRVDQGIFSYWIHAYCQRRPLKYLGFGGKGHQVRDCLHARDLTSLVCHQMQKPAANCPRVLNISGGLRQSASLKELSRWCEKRFPAMDISSDEKNRPFDVPWLVLDPGRAEQVWGWKPQTALDKIWGEIADHAKQNPRWLELTG
jgi:CDP-paratose 2-epimerase